jgi:hypothetical protein
MTHDVAIVEADKLEYPREGVAADVTKAASSEPLMFIENLLCPGVFGAWTHVSEELGEAAKYSRGNLLSIVEAAQAAHQLPRGNPDRIASLMLALAHGAVDLALAGRRQSSKCRRTNSERSSSSFRASSLRSSKSHSSASGLTCCVAGDPGTASGDGTNGGTKASVAANRGESAESHQRQLDDNHFPQGEYTALDGNT